jgi:MATE family multidrug resistance protein
MMDSTSSEIQEPFLNQTLTATTLTSTNTESIIDKNSYRKIIPFLLWKALPNMIYFLSIYGVYAGNLHWIGLSGNAYLLDGIGIGNTWLNCTTVALVISLNVGLVTLSSQAYGAKNYNLMGLYFHRGLILNLMVLCGCYVLLSFSKYLLQLFEVPQETVDTASTYIFYTFPYLLGLVFEDTMKNYLSAQGMFYPQMAIQVFICCLHQVWCYLFVVHFNMGVEGIAISMAFTEWLAVVMLYAYIKKKNTCPKSWFWFRKESFQSISTLAKYEVTTGANVYLSWVSYEVALIFASSYTPDEMGAQVLLFTVAGLVYEVPLGIGVTLNAVTGNAIGEKDVVKAKRLLFSALFMVGTVVIPMECFLYFFKDQIGGFYTTNPEILSTLSTIINIYIFIFPIDCISMLLSCFTRGIGKGAKGSLIFILCNYMIGLPIAFVLGNVLDFYDRGLWYGIGVASYCQLICFTILLMRTDLTQQVKTVSARMDKDMKTEDKEDNVESVTDIDVNVKS